MAIKSILLHMGPDPHRQSRLDTAVELARRFAAHLHVLYTAVPVDFPAAVIGRGASRVYLTEATAVAREKQEEVEAEVRTACHGIDWSWEMAEDEERRLLLRRANLADLAVVTQAHAVYVEDSVRLSLPDRLALEAGCQTLVLPWEGRALGAARRLLIAWRNDRQSARAVRDALPFLTAAEAVMVLCVQPVGSEEVVGHGLLGFLRHHGIAAELHTNFADERHVGEVILRFADELDCDAVVMGAFGHSRLRELVLGGATQHVLGHLRLPVLFSH